jgi:carboxymethylenebutenolidase
MDQIKPQDIDQGVYELFDCYIHGQINRREFLDRASKYAIAGLTASAMLDFLSPDYVHALQIEPEDSRLKSEYMNYTSTQVGGEIRGLLSRPAGNKEKLPGIVVVHENRGLIHILKT